MRAQRNSPLREKFDQQIARTNLCPHTGAEMRMAALLMETGTERRGTFPDQKSLHFRWIILLRKIIGIIWGILRTMLSLVVRRNPNGTVGWARTTDLRIHNPAL